MAEALNAIPFVVKIDPMSAGRVKHHSTGAAPDVEDIAGRSQVGHAFPGDMMGEIPSASAQGRLKVRLIEKEAAELLGVESVEFAFGRRQRR
jgi:hypothetical protein